MLNDNHQLIITKIKIFSLKVSRSKPSSSNQPTGRIKLNCKKKCPEECKNYRDWEWWNSSKDKWIQDKSVYKLVCSGNYFNEKLRIFTKVIFVFASLRLNFKH